MGYGQSRGRRPFERASKIAHAEILNNPTVRQFVDGCSLPAPPDAPTLKSLLCKALPGSGQVKSVIAIDGGMTEVPVRKEYPSASVTFFTFGPLLLSLEDLAAIDEQPFIAPEDMAQFRNIHRFTLVVPTKGVRAPGASSFSFGVRQTIHKFLAQDEPDLLKALQWLVFREWLPVEQRSKWVVPACPCGCGRSNLEFHSGGDIEYPCPGCGNTVYLADSLRLYERIDEELGAGGITSYLLTALEQIVLAHVIRTVLTIKPALLNEVLFVKDGPLAFFGVTAPLHRPMRDLMCYLGPSGEDDPQIHLVGLEKSGPFVEHAASIAPLMAQGDVLLFNNEYIYKYVQPGDPKTQAFGRNTYYGAKAVFKGPGDEVYVATIPTGEHIAAPNLEQLYNSGEVLRVVSSLRCSMYDNALVPVVLANRLVSLADVPSSEILKKFATRALNKA